MRAMIEKMEDMCILFYQEKVDKGCEMLNQILPELTEVISRIEDEKQQLELLSSLKLALQALETREWIMLADVFQYELCDRLKSNTP